MAKSDHHSPPSDPKHSPPSTAAAWGTWEELLLAYAVNRYGTKSWDSISSELRKRSSDPTRFHLSPLHCEQKYNELKQRFNHTDAVDIDDVTTTTTGTAAVPWLEELRNLRVLELQRELQNYDLYISSLQLKVKKLTEESENDVAGETNRNSDLGHETEKDEEPKNEPAEPVEPVVSGDNQSVNGSNGNLETGGEKSENENGTGASPVRTGGENSEPVKSEPEEKEQRTGPDVEASEAPESIAESKSEGKNSDVQSSASKSRKESIDRVRRGSTKGDEIEDQSTDSIPVRSLPLVDFLQKLHKLGSAVFDPRLDRQEKIRYKNLIRQHIDYETLQTRLKEGWYSDGNDKFFRDLLLLVNNTRIFFPKESPESIAAVDLRQLVLKEMISKKKQKSDSKLTDKQTSSKSSNLPPKRATEPADSLLLKPKLNGPIVVCRKRSSITAKSSGGGRQVKEQDSPAKRSVGRPPKRAAVLGNKRNRESVVDSETLDSKQTKKRSKR
ncbi:putative transcription factor MYB-related family [Helianthus annuus]|nr:putative transcription factor MYB-related family [Helianthus annuus]KAJ0782684.1 putative transcription factor MYB-related family [Helianthus annuus]